MITATARPLTARERRDRLTARLKRLEAQSNEALVYGDRGAYLAADEEWHATFREWQAAQEAVEAQRAGKAAAR